MITYEFEAIEHLSLENSFGTIKQAEVKLQVSVGIRENGRTGWFEIWDDATGGDEWHAEGGLWFDGKELVDYDGVFALPQCICDCLRTNGYDPSYAEG
jgi:hypothetical protein